MTGMLCQHVKARLNGVFDNCEFPGNSLDLKELKESGYVDDKFEITLAGRLALI